MTGTLQLSGERWQALSAYESQHDQVVALFREAGLDRQAQEVFMVVPLKDDWTTPGPIEVGRGAYGHVEVSVPALMAIVLTSGCEHFYVAHNHPHGNVSPSDADARLVTKLAYAADALDLTMEDALIFSATGEVYAFATAPKLRAVR